MYEKNMEISLLLDFYGEVLPDRQREMLEMYYNEDYSLAEISEIESISRQGVRSSIKKGEEELLTLEKQLGLWKKSIRTKEKADSIASRLQALADQPHDPKLQEHIHRIIDDLKSLLS